jgi:exopolysaccharide biosynthesis polyprenyl glycosylphosphotransferase
MSFPPSNFKYLTPILPAQWGAAVQQRTFHLSLSERKFILLVVDLLIINSALAISLLQRGQSLLTGTNGATYLVWFTVFTLIWLAVGEIFRIYELQRAADAVQSTWAVGKSAIIVSGLYLLVPLLSPTLPERRLEMIGLPLLCLSGIVLWRWAYATLVSQLHFHQRVLLVGAGWAGRVLAEALSAEGVSAEKPGRAAVGYRILGFVDDDPTKHGQLIAGAPVLGNHERLPELVRRLKPDQIVVAITHSHTIAPSLFNTLLACREQGYDVVTMPQLYEQVAQRIPVEHVGENLTIVFHFTQSATTRLYQIFRRLADVVAGALGCLLLALLIPPVWLANRLYSPGPLFYFQKRVGKGGKPFQIAKFRSMIVDAEKYSGVVWAEQNDPRITPVGRLLRKTRLDEIPQVWNILKGEMSLIGPRPERPYFVDELNKTIPFYLTRHAVRPGLTGWAQVMYRYGASVDDALMKLQYDLYYIKHQGPLLDLQILLKTIGVVVGFEGR